MGNTSAKAWSQTASSVEAIIKEIDDGDLSASKEGRAFLAGALTGMRAAAAEGQPSEPAGS